MIYFPTFNSSKLRRRLNEEVIGHGAAGLDPKQ